METQQACPASVLQASATSCQVKRAQWNPWKKVRVCPRCTFRPRGKRCEMYYKMTTKHTAAVSLPLLFTREYRCDVGQGEVWLVLTDQSLQGSSPDWPCRRTVPLHVNASCALTSCVLKALNDPAVCRLSFTDAIKEHGFLLCVEHSIIEVADSVDSRLTQEPPAQPARLDPLHVEVTPNSLCTLTGVIVGVDESASYSLPVCSQCGSHELQPIPPPGWSFHCVSCNSTMDKPITKVQMEVFLSSASVQNCTIKVKLQHNTIMSLLDTAVLERATVCSDYDVSTVLGKEVGPLTLYVRVVSRRPSLWISLEEICL